MSEFSKILISTQRSNDEAWISTADMMSGLMMVFLFIAIVYIQNVGTYLDDINDAQQQICSQLQREFEGVKEQWMISICEDGLVVNFQNEAIFPPGDDNPSIEFQQILKEFYPRFMTIIWNNREDISELRIEGHTSSEGRSDMSQFEAYLYNTQLSQNRSRNVMNYVLNLDEVQYDKNYMLWSFNNLTAHGLSSSDLILDEAANEDQIRSRRVEFRLGTTAQDRLSELVRTLDETQ